MPKKTDNLIVRMDPDQKAAFMAACEDEGTTASEEARGFIERFVRDNAGRPKPMKETLMTVARNPKKTGALGASLAAAAALAVGALSGPAMAGTTPERLFADADGNSDGAVTLNEFLAVFTEGKTAEEIQPRVRRVVEERHAAFDTNKDGRLEKEEYVAAWSRDAEERFVCLDQDGDAAVTVREWTEAGGVCGAWVYGLTMGGVFARGDEPPKPGTDTLREMALKGESFARMDLNGDGRVTLPELVE